MIKRKIFFLIILITALNVFSQSQVQKELYNAFINNSEPKWKNAAESYKKIADVRKTSDLLQLIHCYYVWTSAQLAEKMHDEATQNIEKAEKLIDLLLDREPKNADALCYKGVFISYHIRLNKLKAMSLGKKAMMCINEAYTLDPNNVQILYDKGNALYYPPKIFGGNKQAALKFYQKAMFLIEQQKNTSQNWMYLQLLLLEGKCYESMGNFSVAEKSFQKALKIEPDFKILRDKIYPDFKEKTKKK